MATYLFTWNPANWHWDTLQEDSASCRHLGFFERRWSCGVTKKILQGDRVFLIKLGTEDPIGIMASGYAMSSPTQDQHYSDSSKSANYTDVRWDILLNPSDERLLARNKLDDELPGVQWSPQASGITIPPDAAARLEELWHEHIGGIGLEPIMIPEEVDTPERYWEGAVRRIAVDAYERDPRARKACLARHGLNCVVCGFDFNKAYGELGKGYIHVHHLKPLAGIGQEYQVDPERDMIPVCPNCHAMFHRFKPPLTPEMLRAIVKSCQQRPTITSP